MTHEILTGDAIDELLWIKSGSIDMIFADHPYGTTQNPWDNRLDLQPLWVQYRRIIKPNGAIVLFAQSPYDKILACSALDIFRYEWIWEKPKATGHLNSKTHPMKAHENILVFYKELPTYNPQKTTGHRPVNSYTKRTSDGPNYGSTKTGISGGGATDRYPRSVIKFSSDTQKMTYNATQKPLSLCEYFILTYTDPGQLVLDNTRGSGTSVVAAEITGWNSISIDIDPESENITRKRLSEL